MRHILPFINIDGKLVDQKSARISILNEESLYGKGIFTTIKVRNQCPLFLDRHLNRLETSSSQLNIRLPSYILNVTSYIQKATYAVIGKNNLTNGGIRITITPSIIYIYAFTIKQFNNKTIKLITTPDTRDIYKTHKLTYRIPHLLAKEKAQSQGAEDALFTQNNGLIESTAANIFSCVSDNSSPAAALAEAGQLSIITPSISGKGLNGISRQILMENLPIQEQDIPANTSNPLILINSLNLRIVENIDGRRLNQSSEFINLIRQTLNKAEKKYIASNSF